MPAPVIIPSHVMINYKMADYGIVAMIILRAESQVCESNFILQAYGVMEVAASSAIEDRKEDSPDDNNMKNPRDDGELILYFRQNSGVHWMAA